MQWVLDAIKEVPKLHDVSVDQIFIATSPVPDILRTQHLFQYPLKAKNFNEDVIDPNFWLKRKVNDEKPIDTSHKEHSIETWVEVGQSRRCFSCGDLKPVQSYNKNEKQKGVEARCISCVATNPMALDFMTICTICKTPTKLSHGETVCQSCLDRLPGHSIPAIKKDPM